MHHDRIQAYQAVIEKLRKYAMQYVKQYFEWVDGIRKDLTVVSEYATDPVDDMQEICDALRKIEQ